MNRKRDAETGQYISSEDASERDRSTWIEESEFNKGKFLKKIFESLIYKSFGGSANESDRVVKMSDIEKLFRKYSDDISINQIFTKRLNTVLKDLIYVSEIDSKVKPFLSGKVDDVTKEVIIQQTDHSQYDEIEEVEFDAFFETLTVAQDWYGDYENKQLAKFILLRDLLKEHLTKLKVFKIGKITRDIYIVGLDPEHNLTGVYTKVVET